MELHTQEKFINSSHHQLKLHLNKKHLIFGICICIKTHNVCLFSLHLQYPIPSNQLDRGK